MPGFMIGSERPGRASAGEGTVCGLGAEELHGRSVGRACVDLVTDPGPGATLRRLSGRAATLRSASAGTDHPSAHRRTAWNRSHPLDPARAGAGRSSPVTPRAIDCGPDDRLGGVSPRPGHARPRRRSAGRRRGRGRHGRQPRAVGQHGAGHDPEHPAVDRRRLDVDDRPAEGPVPRRDGTDGTSATAPATDRRLVDDSVDRRHRTAPTVPTT